MQTRRVVTEITFSVEPSVGKRELREFIQVALERWGGQRHPDDHLFCSLKAVKVTYIAGFGPVKEPKR
jgi:hypothetical protein